MKSEVPTSTISSTGACKISILEVDSSIKSAPSYVLIILTRSKPGTPACLTIFSSFGKESFFIYLVE